MSISQTIANTSFGWYIILGIYTTGAVIVAFIFITECRIFYNYDCNDDLTSDTLTADTAKSSNACIKSKHNRSASKASDAEHLSKLVFILPILSYFFYTLTLLLGPLGILNLISCNIIAYLGPPFWIFSKMWMYLVFIYRLFLVYGQSIFKYNVKILIIMTITTIIYTFGAITLKILTVEPLLVYGINNQIICTRIDKFFFANVIGAIFDIIINTLCCYLFIRPLLKLKKFPVDDEDIIEISNIILKYVILSFIATLSTVLILIIMAVSKISVFVTVDIVINCICIMLFNKVHHYHYQRLCCGMIRVCKCYSV